MTPHVVNVLLVGESAMEFSFLLQRLQKRGCECCVAASSYQATELSGNRLFDLVLCGSRTEGSRTLIASFIGSRTTLFRWHLLEDGCYWVPAVRHGEECVAPTALRPSEFAQVLDRIVEEIKSAKQRSP